MGKIFLFLIAAFVSIQGADTAFHEVVVGVRPLNEIDVIGPTSMLIIDRTNTEVSPHKVTDVRSTYSVWTNEDGKKIIAFLDQELPEGSGMFVEMFPPPEAVSQGAVRLETTPTDIVRGINNLQASGLNMEFAFVARDNVQEMPVQNRMVIFMLIDM